MIGLELTIELLEAIELLVHGALLRAIGSLDDIDELTLTLSLVLFHVPTHNFNT